VLNLDDTLFADPLRRGLAGSEIKGYRIDSLIGRGAQTMVYSAGRGGTRYALKAIPLEGNTRELAEAVVSDGERLKKLRHEHLVTVYDVFAFSGSVWLVCDLAPGRTAVHFTDGMLGWEVTTQVALRVIKGLAYAWRFHGLAHGNLKPSNLFLTLNGGVLNGVRLSDLGFERCHGMSASELVMGASLFVAPELTSGGHADDRADQYSLGAVLHFLLTGQPPTGHLDDEPVVVTSAPAPLAAIVTRLLDPHPEQRFASWDELGVSLERCLSDNPFDVPETTRIARSALSTDPLSTDPRATAPLSSETRRKSTSVLGVNDHVGNWLQERVRETARHARGMVPDALLANGTRIAGTYTITDMLWAGTLIEHYAVDEAILARKLVLKILTPAGMANPLLVQRLIAEGTLLGALHHPSFPFAAGRGSWQDRGQAREYVAVEGIRGVDLKTYLKRKGRFAEGQALWVANELATAMEHAYEACQLVHRDLKPAHLAISSEEPRRLVITDFATALFTRPRDLQDFSTTARSFIDDAGSGKAVGTPAYMSPEQVRGEGPIAQMDMYAFGCVLFQLLTGETPFKAANAVMLMQAHLETPAPDLSLMAEVTPSTAALVARCLAKEARDRFPSWKHLLHSVQSASYATQVAKRRKERGQTATYNRPS
jgi:serine/threonine protein kinase